VYIALRWVLDGGEPADGEELLGNALKTTRSAIKQRLFALRDKEAGWAAEEQQQQRRRRARPEGVQAKREALGRRRRANNPGGD
jgi:hypothetical protein